MLLFKGGVLIYADHCIYKSLSLSIYIYKIIDFAFIFKLYSILFYLKKV